MWDITGNSIVDHVDLLDPCWYRGICRQRCLGLGLLAGAGRIHHFFDMQLVGED